MCSPERAVRDQLDACRSRPARASGRSTLPVATTTQPPGGDQQRDHRQRRQRLLEPVHVDRSLVAAAAPHSSRARQRSRAHGRLGIRLDDDGHLPARVRRAGELIARKRPRTAAGSSGPASSASGRRSAARRRGSAAPARRGRRASGGSRPAGSRPGRRPCGAPRCPSGSRTAPRASRCGSARAPPSRRARERAPRPRAASRCRDARVSAHGSSRIRDVVHEVVGGVPVRHQRAQLALAVDQVDERRMAERVAVGRRSPSRRRCRTPCARLRAARARAGAADEASGRSRAGTCACARRRRARDRR